MGRLHGWCGLRTRNLRAGIVRVGSTHPRQGGPHTPCIRQHSVAHVSVCLRTPYVYLSTPQTCVVLMNNLEARGMVPTYTKKKQAHATQTRDSLQPHTARTQSRRRGGGRGRTPGRRSSRSERCWTGPQCQGTARGCRAATSPPSHTAKCPSCTPSPTRPPELGCTAMQAHAWAGATVHGEDGRVERNEGTRNRGPLHLQLGTVGC